MTLKRNLLLGLLLLSGMALFASAYWGLPVELMLVGLAGFGVAVYLAVRFPEWFLVAALFAPQWKTFWVFQSLGRFGDLTLVMLVCLAGGLLWRIVMWFGRLGYAEIRSLFSSQFSQILAFLVFAAFRHLELFLYQRTGLRRPKINALSSDRHASICFTIFYHFYRGRFPPIRQNICRIFRGDGHPTHQQPGIA